MGEGVAAGIGHEASAVEVGHALFVEFGPMAAFAARREALHQSTVGEFLARGVNPPEAECLLHDVDVGDGVPCGLVLDVLHHPALPCGVVVGLEPSAQLRPLTDFEQINDFHATKLRQFPQKINWRLTGQVRVCRFRRYRRLWWARRG